MIAIEQQRVLDAINLFSTDIDAIVLKRRKALANLRKRRSLNPQEKNYLDNLSKDLDQIVKAKPEDLENFKKIIGKIPYRSNYGGRKKKFKDLVLDCLDYKGLRSDFYPKYFAELGIKACVYCNSQLTVSIETEFTKKGNNWHKKPKKVAKFQVDHFINKGEYPCFSISFYNLYPVCASCNNTKGQKNVAFKLYSKNSQACQKSDYQFKLKK